MTLTMSTSANSVRTLHRPPVEDERHRDHQGIEHCAHCSAPTPPMEPLGTNSASTAATMILSPHAAESITSSLVLPSPPDSPNLSPLHSAAQSPFLSSAASESSLPSVSSSFFFSSSAPGSPGRSRNPSSYPGSYPHSEHEQESGLEMRRTSRREGHNLIIPSLALPSALRRPTPFGQTLGELKLLVLGAQGAGKSFLTGLLLEDNEDVIEVGSWEDWDPDSDSSDAGETGLCYGKVLHASTDWVERKDGYGLERYESTKNVQIVELPGYDHETDPNELIGRLKYIIERPFRSLHGVLHPNTAPSSTIASMLASPTSPLYTALVFLLPSSPTPLDMQIISSMSAYVPLIVLPRLQGVHREPTSSGSSSSASSPSFPPTYLHHYEPQQSSTVSQPKLSSFAPTSAVTLRTGLFHSPETLSLLRKEGVDRFLKWREVEREVDLMDGTVRGLERSRAGGRESVLRKRRFGEREWGRTSLATSSSSRLSPVDRYPSTSSSSSFQSNVEATPNPSRSAGWNKAQWEAEWMGDHSRDVDVARKLRRGDTVKGKSEFRGREGTITERPAFMTRSTAVEPKHKEKLPLGTTSEHDSSSESLSSKSPVQEAKLRDEDEPPASLPDAPPPPPIAFDPLHLPSVIIFSISLLGPLKSRVTRTISDLVGAVTSVGGPGLFTFEDASSVKIALLGAGGFCVGVGVGMFLARG